MLFRQVANGNPEYKLHISFFPEEASFATGSSSMVIDL